MKLLTAKLGQLTRELPLYLACDTHSFCIPEYESLDSLGSENFGIQYIDDKLKLPIYKWDGTLSRSKLPPQKIGS